MRESKSNKGRLVGDERSVLADKGSIVAKKSDSEGPSGCTPTLNVTGTNKSENKNYLNCLDNPLHSTQMIPENMPIENSRRVAHTTSKHKNGGLSGNSNRMVSDVSSIGSEFLKDLNIKQNSDLSCNTPKESVIQEDITLHNDFLQNEVQNSKLESVLIEVSTEESLNSKINDAKSSNGRIISSVIKKAKLDSREIAQGSSKDETVNVMISKKKNKPIKKTRTQIKELSEYFNRSIRCLASLDLLYRGGQEGFEPPSVKLVQPANFELQSQSSDEDMVCKSDFNFEPLRIMKKVERRKRVLEKVSDDEERVARFDMILGENDVRNTYEENAHVSDPDILIDTSNLKFLTLEEIVEEFTALKHHERSFALKGGLLSKQKFKDLIYASSMCDFLQVAYSLRATSSMVFDSVNILYRLLAKVEVHSDALIRALAGCFSIASKHNSQYAPDLNTIARKVPNLSACDLEQMEYQILEEVNAMVSAPNCMEYINLLANLNNMSVKVRVMARYILEQCLFNHHLAEYPTSLLASSAYFVALRIIKDAKWDSKHNKACGYKSEQILPIVKILLATIFKSRSMRNNYVYNKYNCSEYFYTSRLVEFWMNQMAKARAGDKEKEVS